MNFQDDIPSIPIDNLKDHCVLVYGLTSMQHATESCQYPELFREPLRLDLNSTFPLEDVTELIVLRERTSSVGENERLLLQLTSVVVLEKISKMNFSPANI